MKVFAMAVGLCVAASSAAAQGGAAPSGGAPVEYEASFENAVHHEARISVTYRAVGTAPLELRMARSSPGRYAIHEFAKNVYDIRAYDGSGNQIAVARPNPYQWNVTGHNGIVMITYKIYGDLVDGTYIGIDAGHAHMNMPATLMWARRMEGRPARIKFRPPAESWKPATQLFPTADPWT